MAKAAKKTAEESAMAKNEKHNDGTMTGLKKTIIGTVSTLVVGGGTFLMSYLQKPKESESNKNQPAININIPAQQQQATSNKTVIIKEKSIEAKPTAPVKKKDGDEFKKEDPKW
jgi:hypothetical protein